MDDPTKPDCEEALINDIEDITLRDWPNPLVLPMPPIPYTCQLQPEDTRSLLPGGFSFSDQIEWSTLWWGDLRSFLIGRHTASADLTGSVQVSGAELVDLTWSDTSINYLFQEGTTEVVASGGSTGVLDLGPVSFSTPSGAFWNASLSIELKLSSAGDKWRCSVGYPGFTKLAAGTDVVRLSYPIALTPVKEVIAEGVRNQFRRAVRLAVTGEPPVVPPPNPEPCDGVIACPPSI